MATCTILEPVILSEDQREVFERLMEAPPSRVFVQPNAKTITKEELEMLERSFVEKYLSHQKTE